MDPPSLEKHKTELMVIESIGFSKHAAVARLMVKEEIADLDIQLRIAQWDKKPTLRES